MSDVRMDPRLARLLLAGAVVLGILADLLFMPETWRLGTGLWIVVAVGIAFTVFRSPGTAEPSGATERALLLGAMSLGAVAMIARDAEALYVLAFGGTFVAAILLAWRATSGARSVWTLRLTDLAFMPVQAAVGAVTGAPRLALHDAAASPGTVANGPGIAPGRSSKVGLVVGMVIAVPVTIVAASLLAEADPVFGALLERFVDVPFEAALKHVFVSAVFAWLLAGWLRALVRAPSVRPPDALLADLRPAAGFSLIAPAMYVLVALLAVFLLVQARALFGGAAYVETTSGLTYAEYARQGVFGLVAVAVLSLGLLVAGDWLQRSTSGADEKRFRSAGWLLVVLVAVVLASAVHRMALYVEYYGLTDARVYALAVTMMVGLALAWCGMTILRGNGERFAAGVLVLAATSAIVLHVLNPERMAVRVNVARAAAGESFDAAYHGSLSADALPTLRAVAGQLAVDQCSALALKLHEVWTKRLAGEEARDWRAWSIPLARARAWMDVPVADVQQRFCTSAP